MNQRTCCQRVTADADELTVRRMSLLRSLLVHTTTTRTTTIATTTPVYHLTSAVSCTLHPTLGPGQEPFSPSFNDRAIHRRPLYVGSTKPGCTLGRLRARSASVRSTDLAARAPSRGPGFLMSTTYRVAAPAVLKPIKQLPASRSYAPCDHLLTLSSYCPFSRRSRSRRSPDAAAHDGRSRDGDGPGSAGDGGRDPGGGGGAAHARGSAGSSDVRPAAGRHHPRGPVRHAGDPPQVQMTDSGLVGIAAAAATAGGGGGDINSDGGNVGESCGGSGSKSWTNGGGSKCNHGRPAATTARCSGGGRRSGYCCSGSSLGEPGFIHAGRGFLRSGDWSGRPAGSLTARAGRRDRRATATAAATTTAGSRCCCRGGHIIRRGHHDAVGDQLCGGIAGADAAATAAVHDAARPRRRQSEQLRSCRKPESGGNRRRRPRGHPAPTAVTAAAPVPTPTQRPRRRRRGPTAAATTATASPAAGPGPERGRNGGGHPAAVEQHAGIGRGRSSSSSPRSTIPTPSLPVKVPFVPNHYFIFNCNSPHIYTTAATTD